MRFSFHNPSYWVKSFIYSILLSIISIQPAVSQNDADAQRIIDSFLNLARSNVITARFTVSVIEKNGVNSYTNSGTFTLKGNRFVLEMQEMKVWFDGKTQWAYQKSGNEVTITEPSVQELVQTNPMAILRNYRNKCNIRFCKTSSQHQCIQLTPKLKKNEDIAEIEVLLTKTDRIPQSITVSQKNGTRTVLMLSQFQKKANVSEQIFTFDAKKYKDAYINDLR
jgi:outer membrane lipoprotein-sorting protein